MSEQLNDAGRAQPGSRAMTDDEVRAIVDREIGESQGSRIAQARAKAMQYYLGDATGDLSAHIEGRSEVVSTDVADTIEWMLPALVEIFTAGDDVVEFKARKSADEPGAQQTTDVVNYVFYDLNPGWSVLYTWFKDTLLSKNGIVKVWWDSTPDAVREEYAGQTDAQIAMLLGDDSVRPVEHSAYPDHEALQAAQQQYEQAVQQYQQAQQQTAAQGAPMQAPAPQPPDPSQIPMLHDIAVVRTTASGKVRVENVPPEEFMISKRARRIGDGPCGHRVKRTISDLRQRGYQNVDDITSDTMGDASASYEALVRRELDDSFSIPDLNDGEGDESTREVWLTEWYTQMDYDGDGVAEWRKIVRAGNAILENVACDGPCFVSLCAVPLPHLFFGMSPAEQAMPMQKLKTTIWRALIDNMHMQINGRVWAIEDQVNIDDLLTIRAGGVVRVKQANAVGALQQGMSDTAGAYQLLDYADAAKQDRTGVTKYTQGSDADTLNKTAQGLENITQRSDMRIKLVARIFAETGVRELFILIQKLLAQYQDRSMTLKLNGDWVDVDPRAWKNQYNTTVNVGLGTGDKTKQVQHIMALGAAQKEAIAIGVATPKNVYNALKKLTPLMGYKNADEFFTDPADQPPSPPQPDPEAQKQQMEQQTELVRIQAAHAANMEEMQQKERLEMARIQQEAQLATHREQLIDERERDHFAQKIAWEREKLHAEIAQKREASELAARVDAAKGNAQYNADLTGTERGDQ